MLLEILNDEPIKNPINSNDLNEVLNSEIYQIILKECKVDLLAYNAFLDVKKCKVLINTFYKMYNKVYNLQFSAPQIKTFILYSIMAHMFNVWLQVTDPKTFFLQMQKSFSVAQLISGFMVYFNENKLEWLVNFFNDNEDLIQTNHGNAKTIGIYYTRYFSGGIEKFLSMIMPIYISMNYNVVFFTDMINESEEYPPPISSENAIFTRIVFKTPSNDFLSRLEEFKYYIEKYKIDLFCTHQHFGPFPQIFQILFLKLLKIPTIVELHGIFKVYFFNSSIPKIYRLADALVVLSRVNKAFWKNLGCNAYYIPNPIPLELMKNKSSKNLKQNKKNILWIGRIDYDKKPQDIIPIMKEVVKYIPDAKINVVGKPENKVLFDQIQSQIKVEGLENNIIFCGYRLDVSSFYESASVMLMTSPAEGFSYIVSESMIMGVPIVCYELPYLEFFRQQKGYISVRQSDSRSAAMAIVRVLKNHDLRDKLSREAKKNIESFINYDIAGAWRKVFNDVEHGVRHEESNFEMEQIELVMFDEILSKGSSIRFLNQMIQNIQQNR